MDSLKKFSIFGPVISPDIASIYKYTYKCRITRHTERANYA